MLTVGERLVAQGRAEGLAKGEAEGLIIGEAKGRREILLRQLRRRFGEIRGDVVERIQAASIDELDNLSDRIFDAKSLTDVFGADRRH